MSHTFGQCTVVACVVFSNAGPEKAHYRRFNVSVLTPGDDYAALKTALRRHYKRAKVQAACLPDLIMIDGGKGQLSAAASALEEVQLVGPVLMGVAKGPKRKPGLETLHILGRQQPIRLKADSEALHLIQAIRDEAHRFAITGHRKQRSKAQTASILDAIPGIGPVRRHRLLRHFGGLRAMRSASVSELGQVTGISHELAQQIYEALR